MLKAKKIERKDYQSNEKKSEEKKKKKEKKCLKNLKINPKWFKALFYKIKEFMIVNTLPKKNLKKKLQMNKSKEERKL